VTHTQRPFTDQEKILYKHLGCKKARDVNNPDHYELLNIDYNCTDTQQIKSSYTQKYNVLNKIPKSAGLGKKNWPYIQMLIGKLAQAQGDLCDPQRRADYNLKMKETVWSLELIQVITSVADANNRVITQVNIQNFIRKGDEYHLDRNEVMSIIQDLVNQGRVTIDGKTTGGGGAGFDWSAVFQNVLNFFSRNRKIAMGAAAVIVLILIVTLLPKAGGGLKADQIYLVQLKNQSTTIPLQVLRSKDGEITALNLASRERLSFDRNQIDSYSGTEAQGVVVNGVVPGDNLFIETTAGVKIRGTVSQNDLGILILKDRSGIEHRFIRDVIYDSRKY